MRRRRKRSPVVAAGCFLAALGLSSCAEPSGPPSTVILISIDTLRADGLSSYGNPRAVSPNLDQLAREGVRFSQCVATAPWTIPSHASMLTGLYPAALDVGARQPLPEDVLTLAESLAQRGFRTAALINAGYLDRKFGFDQGFQEFHFLTPRKDVDENVDQALEFLRQHRDAPKFLFLHLFDVHAPYRPPAPFDRLIVDKRAVA